MMEECAAKAKRGAAGKKEAWDVIKDMEKIGVMPNSETFTSLIKTLAKVSLGPGPLQEREREGWRLRLALPLTWRRLGVNLASFASRRRALTRKEGKSDKPLPTFRPQSTATPTHGMGRRPSRR